MHWYNQFPKQFLRPYGKIDAPLQSKLIKEKLKPQNSEWFQRPKVATSEIAERFLENLEFVQQLMSGWSLDEMIAILQKYWDMEYPLITKNDAPLIAESLSKMMQFHCTNIPKEVRFFEDMERSGNILFNYAVHFRSLLALIVNTTEYAQQMQMPGGGRLKNNATARKILILEKLFINEVVITNSQQHKGMEDAESILN